MRSSLFGALTFPHVEQNKVLSFGTIFRRENYATRLRTFTYVNCASVPLNSNENVMNTLSILCLNAKI